MAVFRLRSRSTASSSSATTVLTGQSFAPRDRLTPTGVTPGTYGSATAVPVETVDYAGRLSSVSNTTIAVGDLDHTVIAAKVYGEKDRLVPTGIAPGTYGNATQVPQIVEDPYGRASSVTNTTIQVGDQDHTVLAGQVYGQKNQLTPTGVTPGTYGSATASPVLVVNAAGRLSSVTNTTISGTAPGGAAGGVLSGTYPNPDFAVDMATQAELDAHISDATDAHAGTAITNTPAGTIAATTVQAAINELDNDSRMSDARTPTGTAGGDLGGTYPSPTVDQDIAGLILGVKSNSGRESLTPTGVAPGTYGSASVSPAITVDAFGRLSSVTNTTITASGGVDSFGGHIFAQRFQPLMVPGALIRTDYYTTAGTHTWSRPAGAKAVYVILIGGGGGGAGGEGGNTGTARVGGSGGGGGAVSCRWFSSDGLSLTETVEIPAAATGGTAGSSGAGGDGATGGTVTFGTTLVIAYGGAGGDGGTGSGIVGGGGGGLTGAGSGATGGGPGGGAGDAIAYAGGGSTAATAGGSAIWGGGAGGTSITTATGTAGGSSFYASGGGGGGGGATTGNAELAGGAGGAIKSYTAGGGGTGGTAGGGAGNSGGSGVLYKQEGGEGGGGGGGKHGTPGGAGGAGGMGGGGGGGGGGTTTGGVGGAGGVGAAFIMSFG